MYKQGNPGRLFVRSINCSTFKISKHVDYHLQPLVKAIPLYVKDRNYVLSKFKVIKKVPEEMCLVAMDVKYKYLKLEDIAATKRAPDKQATKLQLQKSSQLSWHLYLC